MFFCNLVKTQCPDSSETSFSVSVLTRKETSETKKMPKMKIKTRAKDAHDYVICTWSVSL